MALFCYPNLDALDKIFPMCYSSSVSDGYNNPNRERKVRKMTKYEILKTKKATSDGLHIYNFQQIPQTGYIKVHHLFGENDKKMLQRATKMLETAGLLPAMVEIKEV